MKAYVPSLLLAINSQFRSPAVSWFLHMPPNPARNSGPDEPISELKETLWSRPGLGTLLSLWKVLAALSHSLNSFPVCVCGHVFSNRLFKFLKDENYFLYIPWSSWHMVSAQ